jgi:hypothetical protein
MKSYRLTAPSSNDAGTPQEQDNNPIRDLKYGIRKSKNMSYAEAATFQSFFFDDGSFLILTLY